MKKFFTVLAMFLATMPAVQGSEKNVYVKSNQLPREAQIWLDTYMFNRNISYIKAEKHGFSLSEYEVHFQSGYEVTFDKKGFVKELDFQHDAIPAQLLPSVIVSYVQANYENQNITEYSISKRGEQEIKLQNDLQLVFDRDGQFLRFDD